MPELRRVLSVLTALVMLPYPDLTYGSAKQRTQVRQAPPSGGESAAQQKCQELAESPDDPSRVVKGVPFESINTQEAIPACQAAASAPGGQGRYQFLLGRSLHAANRYSEAAEAYTQAHNAGYIQAAFNLAGLYEDGLGVQRDVRRALALYRDLPPRLEHPMHITAWVISTSRAPGFPTVG